MNTRYLHISAGLLLGATGLGCGDDATAVHSLNRSLASRVDAEPAMDSGPESDAGPAPDAGIAPVSVSPEVQAAADAAFVYGYPLTEMMRVCSQFPVTNHLVNQTTLATPEERTIVLPNNDTLYTTACIYLGAGWVELTMPPPNGRYMSAELFDAYTNEVSLLSARDMPVSGQSVVLHRSGTQSDGLPVGVPVVEVQSPYVFALIRTLVDGPDDLEAAKSAQNLITMTAASAEPPPAVSIPTDPSTAREFFQTLMVRLAQNPPPASETEIVASFAAAGIGATLDPDLSQLTAEQLAAWDGAYATGFEKLTAGAASIGSLRGEWLFPSPNIATPGTDYELRAIVARYGIFPLPPTESIYPRTNSDGGTPHVLHFPSTWPPIDARGFWSLTMYADGYLFDNTIHRYSIGNRTPGLRQEPDGSTNIYVQCTDPGGDLSSNWLPAPCGPYSVTMRLYLPDDTARAPVFTLPPLE